MAGNFGFIPSPSTKNFDETRAKLERTTGGRDLQLDGAYRGQTNNLTRNVGSGRPGEIREQIGNITGETPPGGGVGNFMPMQPGGTIGMQEQPTMNTFEGMPELKTEKILEKMEDPKNQNEDGSMNWAAILSGVAASVAVGLTGGGLGGALQTGAAFTEGAFTGILKGEEIKTKRKKFEASQTKLLNDANLKSYKTIYDAQVKAGDWSGAGRSMKEMNNLSGASVPEADVDQWVKNNEMNDSMKEVDDIVSKWTEDAAWAVANGQDTTGAWRDNGEITDAMVYQINPTLNPGDKILPRHERYAADVITRMVQSKGIDANMKWSEYVKTSRTQARGTHQEANFDIQQLAEKYYDTDHGGGKASGYFNSKVYDGLVNDPKGQADYFANAFGEGSKGGKDRAKFEGSQLKALKDYLYDGRMTSSVNDQNQFTKSGLTEEQEVAIFTEGMSPASRSEANTMVDEWRKQDNEKRYIENLPPLLSKKERKDLGLPPEGEQQGPVDVEDPNRESRTNISPTLADKDYLRGGTAEDRRHQQLVVTSGVVEEVIKQLSDFNRKHDNSTAESIINQLAQDTLNFPELSRVTREGDNPEEVKRMAIEALKGENGEDLVPHMREAAKRKKAKTDEGSTDTPGEDLAQETANEVLRQGRKAKGAGGRFSSSLGRKERIDEAISRAMSQHPVRQSGRSDVGPGTRAGQLIEEGRSPTTYPAAGKAVVDALRSSVPGRKMAWALPSPATDKEKADEVGPGRRSDVVLGEDGAPVSDSQKITLPLGDAGRARSGNTPQRNNSPGNVKAGGIADKFAKKNPDGTPMTDGPDGKGGHLVFETPEDGKKAMEADINAKIRGNSPAVKNKLKKDNAETLSELGSVYSEDPQWAAGVSKILSKDHGIGDGSLPLKVELRDVPMGKLIEAISKQEGYFAT